MEDMKVKPSGYDFEPAHAAMRRYVDGNILPGVSSAVLVGRDLVDLNCVGWADKEAQTPLRVDHIFRVFSNTKLVTSCAALLLFEEGRFQLDDPIERFVPQLANRRVLRPGATSLDETEPANRSITIRHLMSHSSGLSYGILGPTTILAEAYIERNVQNPETTLADMVAVLAELPLAYHPGTSWEYSIATDVLARLVEVISGQRFDAFIQSRMLGPLGMLDTGFVVPEKDRNRLATYYAGADILEPMKSGLTSIDSLPRPDAYIRPVPRLSGGAGLISTLPDMVALIRSLLPGAPTLLKQDTIALMMTNQLPEEVPIHFRPLVEGLPGRGYGLAGAVISEPSPLDHTSSAGELYWGGAAGTQWWISSKASVAGLMMTQRQSAFLHPFAYEFKRLVYDAVRQRR